MQCYRPVQPVKAMTFDLDDTLYDNGPVIASAMASLNNNIARQYPATADLPPAQWTSIKTALVRANPDLAFDMGRLRFESLYEALAVEKLSSEQRKVAAQSLFDAFYNARSDFSVDNKVKQVLKALAEKIPLIAITNGNVDTVKTGLSDYFTTTLHASINRPSKPHRHMFDEAVNSLRLEPQEVLHVGDNLEKDVLGAHRAGLQSAWYAADRPMDLRTEPVSVLPTVQLHSLDELLWFI